jgi:hypothetical protein
MNHTALLELDDPEELSSRIDPTQRSPQAIPASPRLQVPTVYIQITPGSSQSHTHSLDSVDLGEP